MSTKHQIQNTHDDVDKDDRTVLITGVAPLSLGEAIVLKILKDTPKVTIIVVDLKLNIGLQRQIGGRGKSIVYDLNPLNYEGCGEVGLIAFKNNFLEQVIQALHCLGKEGVGVLYNNAGVYDFGSLLETSWKSISTLFGVNALGHTCVLKAIEELNHKHGFDNKTYLSLCEIGSFQGLAARAGRAVYAPSKAFGIDQCQALASGGELNQVVYIAAPPIDTPMLHYNNWVKKAGGPENFWRHLYDLNIELYKEVFQNGNDKAVRKALSELSLNESKTHILEVYSKYKEIRQTYMSPPFDESLEVQAPGVAFAEEVAGTVWRQMHDLKSASCSLPSSIIEPQVHVKKDGTREYDDGRNASLNLSDTKLVIQRIFPSM